MTTRRRRLRRASPIDVPGFAELLNSLVTLFAPIEGVLRHDDT
jgi:hypothetical protein